VLAHTSTSDLPYLGVGAAWQEAHSQMWVDILTSVPQYKECASILFLQGTCKLIMHLNMAQSMLVEPVMYKATASACFCFYISVTVVD